MAEGGNGWVWVRCWGIEDDPDLGLEVRGGAVSRDWGGGARVPFLGGDSVLALVVGGRTCRPSPASRAGGWAVGRCCVCVLRSQSPSLTCSVSPTPGPAPASQDWLEEGARPPAGWLWVELGGPWAGSGRRAPAALA